jgi:hypothetical protein
VDDRVRVTECRRQVIVPSERSHLVGQLTETPPQRRTHLSACPRDGHRARSPALDRLVVFWHRVNGSQHVSSRRGRRTEPSEHGDPAQSSRPPEGRTERAPVTSILSRRHEHISPVRCALRGSGRVFGRVVRCVPSIRRSRTVTRRRARCNRQIVWKVFRAARRASRLPTRPRLAASSRRGSGRTRRAVLHVSSVADPRAIAECDYALCFGRR